MKNLKSLIVLSIIAGIVFYSCTKEDKSIVSDESSTNFVIKNFKPVAKKHNDGLDFIFSNKTMSTLRAIKLTSAENSIDSLAVAQLIFDETNNFIQNQTVIVDGVEVQLHPIPSVDVFLEAVNGKGLGVYDNVDMNLSKEQVISQIDGIMDEYLQNPDRIDYNVVMSTGSVFKHSIEYWSSEENREADFNNNQAEGWFNWISFAFANASGANAGAEIGAVGGPTSAIGGAIAFGLMNSAYNAALQTAIHSAND